MKLRLLILFSLVTVTWGNSNRETYFDFEGISKINFEGYEGTLDSMSANPFKRGCNKTERCAKYLRRSNNQYDNIRINLNGKLKDVNKYATNRGFPPRFTMKVFSTARIGTIVELQMGTSRDGSYPSGIHSQYQATTTSINKWEELTFNYLMTPKGSKVSDTEIDKLSILFAPGTRSGNIFFFDELQGPLIENDNSESTAVIKD